jgi:hypothetical protein
MLCVFPSHGIMTLPLQPIEIRIHIDDVFTKHNHTIHDFVGLSTRYLSSGNVVKSRFDSV